MCLCMCMLVGGTAVDPLPPDPHDINQVSEKRLPPEFCQDSKSTLCVVWVCMWCGVHVVRVV